MKIIELGFDGVFEIRPQVFRDNRGEFVEGFVHHKLFNANGTDFSVAQMNVSVSTCGTIRGIHFASPPAGQAKYVQCVSGAILDIVVDLRVGSASFGKYVQVQLDSNSRNAVHIPSGFGHGFQALTDGAVVAYLCDSPYDPENENEINPLDVDIAIQWPIEEKVISQKDLNAKSLAEFDTSKLFSL
jgi:dTDP-4-dehydrorhamnose 3,5-epimerase